MPKPKTTPSNATPVGKRIRKTAVVAGHLVKKALRKGKIDVVDLGPSIPPTELRELGEKPYRRLHGIDSQYEPSVMQPRERKRMEKAITHGKRSKARLIGRKMEERIEEYGENSVRHFRMSMTLSGLPAKDLVESYTGEKSVFERIARGIRRALVPNGRFRIVDWKGDLFKAARILERHGFSVEMWPGNEEIFKYNSFLSYWMREFANEAKKEAASGKVKKKEDSNSWPWALVAVNRKKR